MSQIPVSDETYSRLQLWKARSTIARSGRSINWDRIIESFLNVCENHQDEFNEIVQSKPEKLSGRGRVPMKQEKPAEVINERIMKGEMVTSEDLEREQKEKDDTLGHIKRFTG